MRYLVQFRKGNNRYFTHTKTDELDYAVMQYKGIRVGKPYSKRLLEVSEDGKIKVVNRVKGL